MVSPIGFSSDHFISDASKRPIDIVGYIAPDEVAIASIDLERAVLGQELDDRLLGPAVEPLGIALIRRRKVFQIC